MAGHLTEPGGLAATLACFASVHPAFVGACGVGIDAQALALSPGPSDLAWLFCSCGCRRWGGASWRLASCTPLPVVGCLRHVHRFAVIARVRIDACLLGGLWLDGGRRLRTCRMFRSCLVGQEIL